MIILCIVLAAISLLVAPATGNGNMLADMVFAASLTSLVVCLAALSLKPRTR